MTGLLTENRIRRAKPKARPYKLRDGGGLYLLITPADARQWRLRYKLSGRESMLALGTYPATSLKAARARRAEMRAALEAGKNPAAERRAEVNLDAAEWRIAAHRTKMRRPLLVPLARQAVAILRDVEPFTARGRYVFPSPRSSQRPLSDNAITAALRRIGYTGEQMSWHGFRAMASTHIGAREAAILAAKSGIPC